MQRGRRGPVLAAAYCALAAPLSGLGANVVFLPFSVSGGPDPALLELSSLPSELSSGARFLFGTQKSYPVQPEGATRRALSRRGLGSLWRGGLSQEDARRACRALDAEYLISGHAHFEAPRRVRLQVRVFGCGAESTISRSESTESWNRLQPTLKRLLREVTRFAPDQPGAQTALTPTQRRVIVVLDSSGSMQSNLMAVERGLMSLLGVLPGTTLTLYSVRSGNPPQRLGPFSTREAAALGLASLRTAGETRLRDMGAALSVAIRDSGAKDALFLLLTDASFGGGGRVPFEAQVRALSGRGIRLRLFEMPGARLGDREAMVRLSQSVGLPDAGVASALEARYIDGPPSTFVAYRGRVFRTGKSLSGALARNSISTRGWEPLSGLAGDERRVALAVSAREGRRIHSFGAPITSLEAAIAAAAVRASVSGGQAGYRVLVRNRGQAFWIRLRHERDMKALRRAGTRAVYLGLRFSGNRGDIPGVTNHPDFLYIREQGAVPRLFVNEWAYLNRLPPRLVRPEDTWFLLCTVIRIRAEGR